MPSAGFYDIYVYIPVGAMYKAPSGRNRGDESQRGGREGRRGPEFLDKGTEYNYVIRSNEGSEDLKFTLNAPENGWNRLGTFHFPSDSAFISLSNNTNGTRVIADAVKWVARD
jgi:hypothetical protein